MISFIDVPPWPAEWWGEAWGDKADRGPIAAFAKFAAALCELPKSPGRNRPQSGSNKRRPKVYSCADNSRRYREVFWPGPRRSAARWPEDFPARPAPDMRSEDRPVAGGHR